MNKIFVALSALLLGACSYMPPRYDVLPDSTAVLKKTGASGISVGTFTRSAAFDNSCAVTSGTIHMPDNMSFEGYIQNGLEEELKRAGAYDNGTPKIVLSGDVDKLYFFTDVNVYISYWDIGLRVKSSNGQSVYIRQHYEFNSGNLQFADCTTIANSYMPAVQQTIYKLVNSPDFKFLVKP